MTSIKKKYKERLYNCEEQWPPVSVETLVNLQLVEAEKKEGFRAGLPQHGALNNEIKRTPILCGDLFKVKEGKKPVRKLIVEGNAGIGKTTLCTMLTEEWANGKIFTQFDCVLLLPLRERSVSTATTLPQLFKLFHSSERIRTSVIEELEEREGEGVLIIADGWDELDQENRSDNSFLYKLLFGNTFSFISVLLTSRPSASAPFHNLPSVDRLVEVVGFTEENVKQYIESEFSKYPEKASSLIGQLEYNTTIMNICSVPLNCAIVCNLWHTLKEALPRTLTELYAKIILNIIFRSHRKIFSNSLLSLSSFDSIPKDLQDKFWIVCKLAFECLKQEKIVFSEDELAFPEVLNASEKLLCLGLLQCARSLLPVGQGLSFHFVHLTIQEFLAALHFVTLPNEEKLKVCETHARSSHFAMLWRFAFGLGFQKERSYSRKVVCLNDNVIDLFFKKVTWDLFSNYTKYRLTLCHCAMESSTDTVCQKVVKQINGQFNGHDGHGIAHTPEDCVAVFHVLRQTSYCSSLTIQLNDCGLTDRLLKELADILFSAGNNLHVKELFVGGNKITDKGITNLLKRGSVSFSSLESFHFSFIQRGGGVGDILPLISNLTSLHLSNSPLGVSGAQSLELAIRADKFVSLASLVLYNTLTDDADINGALLATLLPSIASHCPCLFYLRLSKNNLCVPGASAVGELINTKSNLFVCLEEANITATGVSALIVPNEHSEPSLAYEINLSNNPLGCDGLVALIRVLGTKACPLVKKLTLANITTPSNEEALYHDTLLPNARSVLELFSPSFENRLTYLDLADNNFSVDKVLILAECVRVCKSLIILDCGRCSLTSVEVITLLHHLDSSGGGPKSLKFWHLTENSIDDEGVTSLIEYVPKVFPSLIILNGTR